MKRRILNCFDRLELLVGNRRPIHGSEAPFLVKLLEAIKAERKIVEELLELDGDDRARVVAATELANGWINAAWIGDAEEAGPDQWSLLGGCGRDLLEIVDPEDTVRRLEATAVGGHRDPIDDD